MIKYTNKGLKESGLKEVYILIMLHIQEYESISNSVVQSICEVSKATATRYLGELEGNWIEKIGTTGVGTLYTLKGFTKGSK